MQLQQTQPSLDAPRPFFAAATPRENRIMRTVVIGNALVALFCLAYLTVELRPSRVGFPYIFVAVLVGYFLADFASGVVHWGLDTWFSERMLGRAVAIAREHHTHPQHILGYRFLEHAALGSAPSLLVIGPLAIGTALLPASAATCCAMIVWLLVSGCLLYGTSFHNLCHRGRKSRLVRVARRLGLLIQPSEHWEHHSTQTVQYCVVSGWANPLCDRFKVWRRLERAIRALSGAEPREDDLEWQRTFRETGVLAGPAAASTPAFAQPSGFAQPSACRKLSR